MPMICEKFSKFWVRWKKFTKLASKFAWVRSKMREELGPQNWKKQPHHDKELRIIFLAQFVFIPLLKCCFELSRVKWNQFNVTYYCGFVMMYTKRKIWKKFWKKILLVAIVRCKLSNLWFLRRKITQQSCTISFSSLQLRRPSLIQIASLSIFPEAWDKCHLVNRDMLK